MSAVVNLRDAASEELRETGLYKEPAAKIVEWALANPASALGRYLDVSRPDAAAFAHWCEMVRDLLATKDYITVRIDIEKREPTYGHLKIEDASPPDIRAALVERAINLNGVLERFEYQAKTLGNPDLDRLIGCMRSDIANILILLQ